MKTYKEVYQFPLQNYHGRVYDANNNFVFQFQFYENEELQNKAVNIINNKENLINPDLKFNHKNGLITDNKGNEFIMIRGWGNLTGIGAHRLKDEEAANIQDTFAEYIVERLNKRD